MPIDTRCPNCQKSYRLKDEFLGKRVKCPNADCAKPFVVEPKPVEAAPKPKPAPKAPAPKAPAPAAPPVDAEALAAAMFNDDAGPTAAADTRTIPMVCLICECKWEVPFSQRGKNVVCPECKHRQKVPDKQEKKIDWRDPNANRPSLAKGEEVPEDLRQQMTRQVSDNTLFETGVIKEEVEPVPLAVKLKRLLVVLGVVALIGFGVLYYLQSRREGKEQRFMADALAEVEKIPDDSLAKGQPPLARALLLAAAAEHAIRQDSPAERKLATDRLSSARQLLDQQPPSGERDALLGELAVLAAKFGGDDDQVGREVRLKWTAQSGGTKGAQLAGSQGDVQTEVKRVLVSLSGADLDLRLSVVRRLTRELAKTNHVDLLTEVLGQGFKATEMAEATAQMGLEMHRAGNLPAAKGLAKQARQLLPGGPSPSAQALIELAPPDPPDAPLKAEEKPYSVTPSGELAYGGRMYGAVLNAVKKDVPGAVAVATRGGPTEDRLNALAAVADWADDPAEAVQKAAELVAGENKGRPLPGFALLRLATAAGRGGALDKAEALSAGIADEGLRVWAKADATRAKLEAGKGQKGELSLVEIPIDKPKTRLGHLWAGLSVARNNAAATGDQSAAKEYALWPDGAFKACGLAGLALGIQDRKK